MMICKSLFKAGRRDGVLVAAAFACSVLMSTAAAAQVEEDPYKTWAEETEDPASEPEAPAKAEGKSGEGKNCFPKCRSGYFCHEGKCISMCNPLCGSDEKCTAESECVSKSVQAAPAVVAPVSPPITSSQPDIALVEEEEVAVEEEEPYIPVGVFVSLGFESSECASPAGCKTTPDKDIGFGGHVLAGYGILPWLVLEGGMTFTWQNLKNTNPLKKDPSGRFIVARLGARFFPLGRKNVAEPVLGLHLGYFNWSTSWENENENNQNWESTNHGISLDYSLGLDFKLADRFSLGIVVTVYEPFFFTTCVDSEGGPTGDIDPSSNQEVIDDPVSSCSKYTGKHKSFFFNTGIHAMMIF